VHKLYHNFSQIHVAEDQNDAGNGPDWGHWVSKDFVHWAQLPVAIWNDHYYDEYTLVALELALPAKRKIA
jgi:sucrose-6-phosphate hydrolase SacC (GH32 family)